MNIEFQCRSCGGRDGALVLDLGLQPLANNYLRPEDLTKPEPKFPLRLAVCHGCWLMQIADLVPPVQLFSDYLYFSSFSDAWLRHAQQAAERYIAEFALGRESLVMEIASNDGYLLKNFVAANVPCLGIEPAANIAKVARENGIETVVEFFGAESARRLTEQKGQADLLLGNNVFAHAPDTNDFVAGLRVALKPRGRIVLECPYGADFIEKSEFDTIYHEHVFYFTLESLRPLFARHGLEIFDVERLAIHGGSLRLFVSHRSCHAVEPSVEELCAEERAAGVASLRFYETFSTKVETIRRDLCAMLMQLHSEEKGLAAYGAAAKGNTLLNYAGVKTDLLPFIVDAANAKQGKFMPGSHIPILLPEILLENSPDFVLVLPWNIVLEVKEQNDNLIRQGTKFVTAVPTLVIS